MASLLCELSQMSFVKELANAIVFRENWKPQAQRRFDSNLDSSGTGNVVRPARKLPECDTRRLDRKVLLDYQFSRETQPELKKRFSLWTWKSTRPSDWKLVSPLLKNEICNRHEKPSARSFRSNVTVLKRKDLENDYTLWPLPKCASECLLPFVAAFRKSRLNVKEKYHLQKGRGNTPIFQQNAAFSSALLLPFLPANHNSNDITSTNGSKIDF